MRISILHCRVFAILAWAVILFMAAVAQVSASEQRYNVPIDDSPQRGPDDAPVTIIEFIDFQ